MQERTIKLNSSDCGYIAILIEQEMQRMKKYLTDDESNGHIKNCIENLEEMYEKFN